MGSEYRVYLLLIFVTSKQNTGSSICWIFTRRTEEEIKEWRKGEKKREKRKKKKREGEKERKAIQETSRISKCYSGEKMALHLTYSGHLR